MSAAENPTPLPLTEVIRDVALSGAVSLPPLPESGQKLLELLRDREHVNMQLVGELVNTDPALAAATLRLANSAYFGGLQRVEDVGGAIARLGLRRVTSLVTTLIHRGQFEAANNASTGVLRGLWHHAVASAVAARQLASLTGGDAEESYLAGLLHDTGKLLVLKALDHIVAGDETFDVSPAIMDEILESTHSELGYRVLSDWKLSDSICEAVLHHHDDPDELENMLALRVQAADGLTKKLGAHPKPDPDIAIEDIAAVERLNLTEVEMAALMVDVEDELQTLKGLF